MPRRGALLTWTSATSPTSTGTPPTWLIIVLRMSSMHKLQAQGLTLVQLVTALNNSSTNVGGQTLNVGAPPPTARRR
jgi:hypothetical protein